MTNRMRWLVTLAVAAAVAAPAVWPHAADGFPISTYPMFTAERGRVVALDTVVRVDGRGRHRLSPEEVGGTDEVVLASATVGRAIAEGDGALDRLCREVARRVGAEHGTGAVEVVTEVYDTIELVRHGAPPEDVIVHRRCELPG